MVNEERNNQENQAQGDEMIVDGTPISEEEMSKRGVPTRDETQSAPEQEKSSVQVENISDEMFGANQESPAERMANNAREQAGAAANALRRGEFMRDAAVDPGADNDDRLIALLSYATQILIPFVMPGLVLLSESSKKRPFQRFHAIQSLALTAILIILGIFIAVGATVVGFIPIIGWAIAAVVGCLMPIAILMAWFALVYYGYQAYQGKRFAIPGLTSFLKDQGWI